MSNRHIALLPANLEPLYRCAAEEDSARFAMGGVHLAIDGDKYTATATDGRVLATVTGTMEPEVRFPALPDLMSAPNSGTRGVIGTKDWRAAFKRIPGVSKKRPRSLAVVMGAPAVVPYGQCGPEHGGVVTIGTASGERGEVSSHMLLDGRYPDVRQVFPRRPATLTVRIAPEPLLKFLNALSAMVHEDARRATVTFGLNPNEFAYTCKGASMGRFVGTFEAPHESEGQHLTISFDPRYLAKVCALAASFRAGREYHNAPKHVMEAQERAQLLALEFRDESTPILITSEGSGFRGLVMPLS